MKHWDMSQKQEIELLIEKFNVLSQISTRDINELKEIIQKLPQIQLTLVFDEISIHIEENEMISVVGSRLDPEDVLKVVPLSRFYPSLKEALIEKIKEITAKTLI
jgi:hypothetical protein